MKKRANARPRIAVLYHFFHPDDVVSARHFTQLCVGLHQRGWEVEVFPCNRSCRDPSSVYPLREHWEGLRIRRVWRPPFDQSSVAGRLCNTGWMVAAWLQLGLREPRQTPDVVLIGTDPLFSVVVLWALRFLRSRARRVHWCFDLYPEAASAAGIIRQDGWWSKLCQGFMRQAYRSCDLIADLGQCMRDRLDAYGHPARRVTIVPWALVEPATVEKADAAVRRELFGDAALGLLYSGNFGRAHSYQELLELARLLQGSGVEFCFAVRGNGFEELKAARRADDNNVRFAGFAPESALAPRLAAADIHMVSLRPEWSGIVIPSKFFGSLAAGRPVLYAGPGDSAVAGWIEEHGVGWLLTRANLPAVAERLQYLARNPLELQSMQEHCRAVYHRYFSQEVGLDQWHRELRGLLEGKPQLTEQATRSGSQ